MVYNILLNALFDNKKPTPHVDKVFPTQASCHVTFQKYKKLYGSCLRASYYSCIGKEEDISKGNVTLEDLLKREMGKSIEKMVLGLLSRSNRLKEKKVSFIDSNYSISGEIDAIIIEENDKEYGLEIKSIGGDNYYTNRLIYESNCPKWRDLFQTAIYCYVFKKRLPNGFILLYIRRDTGDTKEFKIQVEPYKDRLVVFVNNKPDERFSLNDILERYKILLYYVQESKVPPKDFIEMYDQKDILNYYKAGIISKKKLDSYYIAPFGDSECKYCKYKISCKNED